ALPILQRSQVVLHLTDILEAWNDAGDFRVIENPAHGSPGHIPASFRNPGQLGSQLHTFSERQTRKCLAYVELLPVRVEIPVVVLAKLRILCKFTCQETARQRQSRQNADSRRPGLHK